MHRLKNNPVHFTHLVRSSFDGGRHNSFCLIRTKYSFVLFKPSATLEHSFKKPPRHMTCSRLGSQWHREIICALNRFHPATVDWMRPIFWMYQETWHEMGAVVVPSNSVRRDVPGTHWTAISTRKRSVCHTLPRHVSVAHQAHLHLLLVHKHPWYSDGVVSRMNRSFWTSEIRWTWFSITNNTPRVVLIVLFVNDHRFSLFWNG